MLIVAVTILYCFLDSARPAAFDFRRQAARRRSHALGLQHSEGVDAPSGSATSRRYIFFPVAWRDRVLLIFQAKSTARSLAPARCARRRQKSISKTRRRRSAVRRRSNRQFIFVQTCALSGRAWRRMQYNRRYVNQVQQGPGRKRGPNSNTAA